MNTELKKRIITSIFLLTLLVLMSFYTYVLILVKKISVKTYLQIIYQTQIY